MVTIRQKTQGQIKTSTKAPRSLKVTTSGDEAKTKRLGGTSVFAEVGHSGLKRFGGLVSEEFLPELRGKRGVRIYTEMAFNDGSIGAVIRATEDIIRSVDWAAEPGGDTPADLEARDFVLSCMYDMSLSWSDLVSSIVSMIIYGWDWEEVVYKIRQGPNVTGDKAPSKYSDGRIGWRKIVQRSQDSLEEWILDDNGGIRGMVQRVADFSTRIIPIEKSLLFRTRRSRNNPEGYSYLRSSYLAWYMKKNFQEIEGIGAERDFTGALIINLPARATQTAVDKAIDLIERWKIDEQFGAAVPDGWKIEILNSPGNKQIDTDKAILRYQAEIMMSFLAQFIRLGQVKVGTQALVTGQRDFFYMAIKAIVDNIEDTVNRFLIPPLIRLNDFGNLTDFPAIVHGEVGQTDVEVFIEAIARIAQTNPAYLGTISKDDVARIRATLGLPPLQETAEEASEGPDEVKPKTSPKISRTDKTKEEIVDTTGDGHGPKSVISKTAPVG